SPNAAGWNKDTATVTLSAADNPGGTGVKQISYYATGAQSIGSLSSPKVVPISADPNGAGSTTLDLTTEGATTLFFFATDNAGNAEVAKSISVQIDRTTPTMTFGTPSPMAGDSGWSNSDVSIPFSAGDDLSGVAATTPGASPVVLSAEGEAVVGTVTVTDKAGNSASFTTPPCKIDKTPPQITGSCSPLANGSGRNNTDVTVSFA